MFKKNILSSYLIKNTLVVFLVIFFIIAFLIFSNFFTVVLKSSLDQNLDILSLLSLVFIRSLGDISLIINLSLFLAIIIATAKLYKDSEITALSLAGIGELLIFKKILPLIITMSVIVFFISMFLVPYSDTVKKQIIQKNANTTEFHFIKTNEFQEFRGGNLVLYTNSSHDGSLSDIFLYSKQGGNQNITLARSATRYQDGNNNVYLRLKDGASYQGFLALEHKKIFDFESFDIKIISSNSKLDKIKPDISGKSISELLLDSSAENIAEFVWRLSLPINLLIMSFIGVLLAKKPPRGGKNLGILVGVIIFAIYFNILEVIKSNANEGSYVVAYFLLTHLLFIIAGLLLYFYNNKVFTKISFR